MPKQQGRQWRGAAMARSERPLRAEATETLLLFDQCSTAVKAYGQVGKASVVRVTFVFAE